jgi:phenylpropionate dioxygenase-like ring-hydroxylating dioxygenase large terminal subunit
MLSAEDNEIITRCGPGTLMGNLMRQYWIPAVQSAELPMPDCPPLRIRMLNENLIAFRATSGRVGIIADACPHRGASMFFGRVEEEGIRCVYHGWKFDTTGQCVDIMNEPVGSTYATRVKAPAYPTRERNGIIWCYMGPREVPPPLPDLEANMMVAGDPVVRTTLNNYNWVQAIENNMDTSHNGILHFGAVTPENALDADSGFDEDIRYLVADRAPRFEVRDTDFGCTYGAYRETEDGRVYWRTMHWLFPFYSMSPVPKLGTSAIFGATVPVDDNHCMGWSMARTDSGFQPPFPPQAGSSRRPQPNTQDWLGRFRNSLWEIADKDFEIDRDVQRAKPPNVTGFTGMRDINTQDEAMRWSQGRADSNGILDRSTEHLVAADAMIIRFRSRLLEAAKALHAGATSPPGVDNPMAYRVRSGWIILPRDADWWEASAEARDAFKREAVPVLP